MTTNISNPLGHAQRRRTGRRMMQIGVSLFLLGLLTGFAVPLAANPRMALSSHLEGVINGVLLIVLGLLWDRLRLTSGALRATFWLALYGTFTNWITTLLAAMWGAGRSMPLAAQGITGSDMQERIVDFGLYSLSLAMIIVCVMVIIGLRGADPAD